jgi:hypothetical protein
METISIASSSMLVELSISCWTARKLDKKVSQEVDEVNEARARSGNYNKNLLAGTQKLDDIIKFAAVVRSWHVFNTLPWSDKGTRLLPMQNFLTYKQKLNEWEESFNVLVQEFLVDYPLLVDAAAFHLGKLFNRDEYPDVNKIADKFRFYYTFSPVPTANDFRIDINEQAKQELIRQFTADSQERLKDAMGEAWERLHKCLTHMSGRLAKDATGDNVGFKDSMISNALELVEMLSVLNITKDTQMEQARKELASVLVGVDAKDLRKNDDIRTEVKTRVDEILSKFSF